MYYNNNNNFTIGNMNSETLGTFTYIITKLICGKKYYLFISFQKLFTFIWIHSKCKRIQRPNL